MKVELGIGDVNFVFLESSHDDTEGVATNLKLVRRVASDDNLIVERGGIDLSDSLIGGASDAVMTIEFFDDFLHDLFGFVDFEIIGQRNGDINITRVNLDFINVAIGDGDSIHGVDILNFGSEKTNGGDRADIVTEFDDVTDFVVIIRNDDEATNDIF